MISSALPRILSSPAILNAVEEFVLLLNAEANEDKLTDISEDSISSVSHTTLSSEEDEDTLSIVEDFVPLCDRQHCIGIHP